MAAVGEVIVSEWKARDKETYSSAITKKLVNLGIEAKEDGVGEYYEDAVLDFWTDIPTEEKHKAIPAELVGKELYPGIIIATGDTPMTLFSRILKDFPVEGSERQKRSPKDRPRVFAIKQLTIDLYDRMEILRGRHRKSRTTEKDIEDELADWAPS